MVGSGGGGDWIVFAMGLLGFWWVTGFFFFVLIWVFGSNEILVVSGGVMGMVVIGLFGC